MDVGGNCLFLKEITIETIKKEILYLFNNPNQYQRMKTVAQKKGITKFSYFEIAKYAIEQ